MLSFLFRRLTPPPARGEALYAALVAEARKPHWYLDGEVPDTIDGRFAMLTTILALATVRLERAGEDAEHQAVGLAERFVEAMDSEHREMGVGDPALGKTVRRLVAVLARRVDLWRRTTQSGKGWSEAVETSLFRDGPAPAEGIAHCERALRGLWSRLEAAPDSALMEGTFG